MIGAIVQVIAVEKEELLGDPPALTPIGKPDMGPDIHVRVASRILKQYKTAGGKCWWKAVITADSNQVLKDWRDQPGNIGWESDNDPRDADADKIWAGLRPLLEAEKPAGHTVWFIAPPKIDFVTGAITGPNMVPAVEFDSAFLHIDALRNFKQIGLWSGDLAAGQGAAGAAWLAAHPGKGINGDLPVSPNATTRAIIKTIARDMAHEGVKFMGLERNE